MGTYMNGHASRHELERARAREVEAQQRAEDGRKLDAALIAAERKIATLQGRIDGLLIQARQDRELVEAIRVATWAKTPGSVTGDLTPHGDRPFRLAAPQGWPEGTDEEAAVDAYLRASLGVGEADG